MRIDIMRDMNQISDVLSDLYPYLKPNGNVSDHYCISYMCDGIVTWLYDSSFPNFGVITDNWIVNPDSELYILQLMKILKRTFIMICTLVYEQGMSDRELHFIDIQLGCLILSDKG